MRRRSLSTGLIWLGALGLVVIVAAGPALAQKKFLEKVRRHYQLGLATGKCALCHELKDKEDPHRNNLNAYGKEIQLSEAMKPLLGKDDEYKFTDDELATLMKIVQGIEDKDSDSDGATNKEELELGTFPGDKESKPEAAKLEKYRKDHPKK